MPSCPKKALASAKKNYSGFKDTNIIYHLLRVVPQLFIAVEYSVGCLAVRCTLRIEATLWGVCTRVIDRCDDVRFGQTEWVHEAPGNVASACSPRGACG